LLALIARVSVGKGNKKTDELIGFDSEITNQTVGAQSGLFYSDLQ
jgi:hypothetical protein